MENIRTLSSLVLIKDFLFYVKLMSSNDSPAPEVEVKLPVLHLAKVCNCTIKADSLNL